MTNREYISPSFRPKLPYDIPLFSRSYLRDIEMPQIAVPAPTREPDKKAALWAPEYPDEVGELAVLAVVITGRRKKNIDGSARWFIGFIAAKTLEELDGVKSRAPREALMLACATSGNLSDPSRTIELMHSMHKRISKEEIYY